MGVWLGKWTVNRKLFHVEQLKAGKCWDFSHFWTVEPTVATVKTTVATVRLTVEFHRDGDRRLQSGTRY